MSVQETRGRIDCGPDAPVEPVDPERFRGVRILDISDVRNPRQVAAVQTCRGSHTHTLISTDPADPGILYVYNSGTNASRPAAELAAGLWTDVRAADTEARLEDAERLRRLAGAVLDLAAQGEDQERP